MRCDAHGPSQTSPGVVVSAGEEKTAGNQINWLMLYHNFGRLRDFSHFPLIKFSFFRQSLLGSYSLKQHSWESSEYMFYLTSCMLYICCFPRAIWIDGHGEAVRPNDDDKNDLMLFT